MSVAIKFENISKQYRLGEVGTGTLSHDLHRAWARFCSKPDPFAKVGQVNDRTQKSSVVRRPSSATANGQRPTDDSSDYVWALKDIDFKVEQGEILGIIGRNGAGKSTLLKLLSRVTAPTTGRIKAKGRIASLLEVGTGFHPELTGRENIYLNGAILGMRRHEISKQLEAIIEFSGCARYIDTPVKRYSSGMTVRLGFAVAAHLECEILVVDEVLAVGDAQFQKKSLGKMQDVSQQGGKTILFVSHNMAAVRTLCSKGVILRNGMIQYSGAIEQAIDKYLEVEEDAFSANRAWSLDHAPGDDVLRLRNIRAIAANDLNQCLVIEEDIEIEIEYDVLQPHPLVSVSIHLHTHGACAFVGGTESSLHDKGSYRTRCRIPSGLLNNTSYSITVFLITNATEYRVLERDAITIFVEESRERGDYLGTVIGVVRPKLEWYTECVS